MNKKSEVTLTGILLAFLFVSFVVGSMVYFVGNIDTNYSGQINRTQLDDLEVYNQMQALNSNVTETSNRIGNISSQTSAFDLLGSIFSSGWSAAITTKNSVATMQVITNKAIEDSNMGDSTITNNIRTLAYTILLIVVFITILLAFIVKWRT